MPSPLEGRRWWLAGIGGAGMSGYALLAQAWGAEVRGWDRVRTPYLERLDNPSEWTRKMMRHYRGMTRGLCSVVKSVGFGMGGFGLLVRFKPKPDKQASLQEWLGDVMVRDVRRSPCRRIEDLLVVRQKVLAVDVGVHRVGSSAGNRKVYPVRP